MRKNLDKEMLELNTDMLEMSRLLEKAINGILMGIQNKDEEIFKDFDKIVSEIGDLDSKIQSNCLRILLEQQPVATDFRRVSAGLKMITDIKRIGDQCNNIAKIILETDSDNDSKMFFEIEKISRVTSDLVKEAIYAFIRNSAEDAQKVIEMDDAVDQEFIRIKEAMVEEIRKGKFDAELIVNIIIIARYFERIADHGTRIARWVIFSIKGE